MSKSQLILGSIAVVILIAAGVIYNTIALFEGIIIFVLFIIVIPLLYIHLNKIPKRDERHRINDEEDL
jgi:hypothetical protein